MWHALRPYLLVMVADLYFRTLVVNGIAKPLKIYGSSAAIIFFSKNGSYYKTAKLIELKYPVVKEEFQKQRVSIECISQILLL